MNRFFSVFIVVAASCTFAFAASTNITSGGSVDLSGFQFSGSGDFPTNYAANVENATDLQVSGSTFDGGAGGSTSEGTSIVEMNGGSGLRIVDVDATTVSDSEFRGGNGGTITGDQISAPSANAGHGIDLSASSGQSDLSLATGTVATGGSGGTINNGAGKAKAFGGDGVHVEFGSVDDSDNAANLVVAEGTYQGGKGGSVTYNSNTKEGFLSTILSGTQNGARGGHGLYVFENFMFRESPRVLSITNGIFTGGAGGTAVNSDTGDVIADGGSGIYVGSVSDAKIFGGTFVGGAAGTTNGVAANGGFGATFWDSNVEISGGDFSGAGGGLFFASVYYDSTATINSGRFDSIEFRAITSDVPGFQGHTTANISGGDLGNVTFSGAEGIDATFTGGSIGTLHFTDSGARNVSIADATTISTVSQNGGTANVTLWSDHHFTDTTVSGGAMNFTDPTHNFNLADGSSFSVRDAGTVDFGGGFTAESGSQITTTYDGTNTSKIAGGALEFKAGTKWTVNGVSTIANGTELTMASGSSIVSGLLDSDVDDIGGSWAAGLSVDVVGTDLIGTYGYVALDDALDLDPNDGGYGTAMAQWSAFTDFANSGDDQFVGLKDPNLSQEAADGMLQEQFANNAMVGAVIQLQGVFADQIKNRTRSHLRNKNWGGKSSYSPSGAQGPEAWNNGMDRLNDSLPSWDARGSLKAADASVPSWDVRGSLKAADANAPKWDARETMRGMDERAPRPGKIEVPSTYQVWGRGYGTYFKQDDTREQVGYDGMVGGGVLGMDKRFENLLLGLGGGYANTRLNGNGGGDDQADTFYGTAYAAATGEKGFIDFNLNYAFNQVETEGGAVAGSYRGDYDANTFSMYVGGGLGYDLGKNFLFTPEASLLTTYYSRESYTETPASPASPVLAWNDYDQWSHLGSLGATLSMLRQFENFNLEMGFQPEIRAHWLHEFNADMDNDSYIMQGNTTPIGVALLAREEDLIKVGAGVRFSKWESDTLEFGLDIDGIFGSDYEAYVGSFKMMHRF